MTGKQEIQQRYAWRGQRHPHQSGIGQADVVGEARRSRDKLGPLPRTRAFEPEFQDPVANGFGDEQVRLVRRQHDTVCESEVLAQHRYFAVWAYARQTPGRSVGNYVIPKLIPRSAVRRCRKVQRPVRTDDRVAAEVKALAVELLE